MQMLKTTLAEHPFFKGFDQGYLNVIVGCAGDVRFDPGDYISRQGEEADQFYLIRQGRVVLEAVPAPGREPIIIQVIKKAMCSAGRGSFRHTAGISTLGLLRPLKVLYCMGNTFVQYARKTMTLDTNS